MEGSAETQPTNNEGRIALWPARNREVGDKQPYLTGHFTLDGEKYLITLWKRDRKSDREPTLSGHIQREAKLEV
jgi:hypothetical protein